jgi:hypothetical protein
VRKDCRSVTFNVLIEMDAIADFGEDILQPPLSIDQFVTYDHHPIELEQVKGA